MQSSENYGGIHGRYELPHLLAEPHARWSYREIQPGISEEIFPGNCRKWGCVGRMQIYVDQWQCENAGLNKASKSGDRSQGRAIWPM